jgi:phosphoglycolate phosphatase-like HAD superfamily hydrolase
MTDLTGQTVSADLRDRFAALRPIVESGWEMVAMVGLLAESDPAADRLLRDGRRWAAARDAYLRARGLERGRLTAALDGVREQWIATDRPGWLAHHRFYPGVADWLRRLVADGQPVYVISTKGKPFLDALFAWQEVSLPDACVIGKAEPRREKWDVLRDLAASHGLTTADLWFVEDRLATLLELRAKAADIAARLFFAEWGFVFPDADPPAARAAGIPVLGLAQMTGRFEEWPVR